MKQTTIIITTLLFLFSLSSVSSISAQTPSPEPEDVTSSSDEAIQQNLKDRLKKVIEEKSERIKGITDGAPKKGFIGVVRRISEEALTLDTPRGPVVLTITGDIQFFEAKKTIARTDIEISNEVVVIGTQVKDEFAPERIYLSKTPLRPPTRTIIVGNVKKVEKNSVTILTRAGEEKIFAFTTKTRFTNTDGEVVKVADVEIDQDVLIVSVAEEATAQTVKNSSGRVTVLRTLGEVNAE